MPRLLGTFSNFIRVMNARGCMEGLFSFFKYDIGEEGVGLVLFFNKKPVIIILEPQLCN